MKKYLYVAVNCEPTDIWFAGRRGIFLQQKDLLLESAGILLFPDKKHWCNLVNYDYSGWCDVPYSLVLQ
jgi:hypothetical protein